MQENNKEQTHEYLYLDIYCKKVDIKDIKAIEEAKLTDLLLIMRLIHERSVNRLVKFVSLNAAISSMQG